jgi:hypothetical protein
MPIICKAKLTKFLAFTEVENMLGITLIANYLSSKYNVRIAITITN